MVSFDTFILLGYDFDGDIMFLAVRLKKGQDLKKEIEKIIRENKVKAAVVISAVGCLDNLCIRLAGGKTFLEKKQDYEIVSLMGTICKDGSHLHIAVSDANGKTYGGHLCYNCIVNTTCELVLACIDAEYDFSRVYDDTTGYKELVIKKEELE
ncbi:MAG: DNA-binding protein [Erysipelotrichia bacterium]|nr:DNA-binding protein [Erysipelotrichia bacterium]